jgi:hypothetical protein
MNPKSAGIKEVLKNLQSFNEPVIFFASEKLIISENGKCFGFSVRIRLFSSIAEAETGTVKSDRI